MLELKNVTKKFRRHQKKLSARPGWHLKQWLNNQQEKDVVSLDNINLVINAGEIVGVIGKNGSGKTTLLKTIAKIYRPNSGTILWHGKIVELFENHAGSAKKLSLKENITLRGLFYGLTVKEINQRYQKIIQTAGLIINPYDRLKTLSYGSGTRISLAIALHSDPNILIIDETLSMGDQQFKQTVIEEINQLAKNNCSIIIASHELDLIKNYCTRTIVLNQGKIVFDGSPTTAIDYYLNHLG